MELRLILDKLIREHGIKELRITDQEFKNGVKPVYMEATTDPKTRDIVVKFKEVDGQ